MIVQISERELEHMGTFKFVMRTLFEANLKKERKRKKEKHLTIYSLKEGYFVEMFWLAKLSSMMSFRCETSFCELCSGQDETRGKM